MPAFKVLILKSNRQTYRPESLTKERAWLSIMLSSPYVKVSKPFEIIGRVCWYVLLTLIDPDTKQKKRLKKSTYIRIDAKDSLLSALQVSLELLSKYLTAHDAAPIRLGQFIKSYINKRTAESLAPSYIREFTKALNAFIEFIGVDRPLHTITGRDVRDFLSSNKLTGSVAHAYYRYLTTAFGHALLDERITFNPCESVDQKALRRRCKPRPRGVLTPDNVISIYKTLPKGTFIDRTYANFLLFLYATGLRRGEACHLKRTDIDLESGIIHVRSSDDHTLKTDASHADIPIVELSKFALEQQRQNIAGHAKDSVVNTAFIFCNSKGNHYRSDTLSKEVIKRMKAACETLGLSTKGIDLHSLRHSIIQHQIDSGAEAAIVSKFARHAHLSTTLSAYHKTSDTRTKFESVIKVMDAIPIPI